MSSRLVVAHPERIGWKQDMIKASDLIPEYTPRYGVMETKVDGFWEVWDRHLRKGVGDVVWLGEPAAQEEADRMNKESA